MKVKLSQIKQNPYNTREDYGDLSGLVASIKKFGLIQPFLVRRTDDGYELAFGSRRYEALKKTDAAEIDVEVRNISNSDMATMAICENVHRKDLNAVEQARAYERGLRATKLSVHAFAQSIGTSNEKVRHYLTILNLPQKILNEPKKYNRGQLIGLGRLQALSESVRIMLENRLENISITSNFLHQIIGSCESIYSANLPIKTKQGICYEIIFHDYSAVPPENFRDIRTFSDALLGSAIRKYQESLQKTAKARQASPISTLVTRSKPKNGQIKKIADIVHVDQKLEDVTLILREASSSVKKAIEEDYYTKASGRSKKKFQKVVNLLASDLEEILKNEQLSE